jgi:ribosomal protein S18 acetylase RimI-like enzyme
MSATPPDEQYHSALHYPTAELVSIFNQSFEGYLMPAQLEPAGFERLFRAVDLDPATSFVCERGGAPAGLVLVSRRGWTSRIAAMGVVKAYRRHGIGRRMMERAIADARARADRALMLEVIEQNTAAVALYTGLGFGEKRRLLGFQWPGGAAARAEDALTEVDPLAVARAVVADGAEDLPWQLAGETLATATPPARGFTLDGKAYALISEPTATMVRLQALVVARGARRHGIGRRMLAALAAAFPQRTWQISPLVPEGELTSFLLSCGWQLQPLSQIELRMRLR